MLRLVHSGPSPYLSFEELERFSFLFHLFTVRQTLEGLSPAVTDPWLAGLGRRGTVVSLRQLHGASVQWLEDTIGSLEGDGLLTASTGMVLTIRTADCLPVILVDPERRCVGNLHAGWRGTLANITGAAIRSLVARGSQAADLRVAFGPAIGGCCYEVGPEVVEPFRSMLGPESPTDGGPWFHQPTGSAGRLHLDLPAVNRHQAIQAGVPPEQVFESGFCTRCRPDLFYSYRRDGAGTGRMFSIVGIQ